MPPQSGLDAFREVWLADFEFSAPPGERPTPVCLAARELRSGRTIRWGLVDLQHHRAPPYPVGPDVLFVGFAASTDLGCHLALGWPMPERILDLCVEFHNLTNGLVPYCGKGLSGALTWFGLDASGAVEKATVRQLVKRGAPWTVEEQQAILHHRESFVSALAALLRAMSPQLDLPRAILRGRYLPAIARSEWIGVPIDTETLACLRDNWTSIQDRLIRSVDSQFGVYEGRIFKADAGPIGWPGVGFPGQTEII